MKLPAHNRYDYVPIHKRPQYEWPEGARLAVTLCSNIEYFASEPKPVAVELGDGVTTTSTATVSAAAVRAIPALRVSGRAAAHLSL